MKISYNQVIVIKWDHANKCRKNDFDKHQVRRFGLYTVCDNFWVIDGIYSYLVTIDNF